MTHFREGANRMTKSVARMIGGCSLGIALGLCGCESSDVTQGVPKDVGYVAPKMQPGTAAMPKGKPQLGVTEKDKIEAKKKAEAAGPQPPPSQ